MIAFQILANDSAAGAGAVYLTQVDSHLAGLTPNRGCGGNGADVAEAVLFGGRTSGRRLTRRRLAWRLAFFFLFSCFYFFFFWFFPLS